MSVLRAAYNLQYAPVTSDFMVFLVGAECARQLSKRDKLHVSILAGQFRKTTARDKAVPDYARYWRIPSMMLFGAELLPTVSRLEYIKDDSECTYDYPPEGFAESGVRFPYIVAYVLQFYRRGANPVVLKAPFFTRQAIFSAFKGPYVTLTIRTNYLNDGRNSNISIWHEFYKWLVERGHNVVVVPDTEDAIKKYAAAKYDWKLYPQAAMDIRTRMALYEEARMNFFTSNGNAAVCPFSKAPMATFDLHLLPDSAWEKMLGYKGHEQLPWCAANQQLIWQPSTLENLQAKAIEFGF